jgi:CheY-like chemotaxis protein
MRKNILLVDDEKVFHFVNSKVIALTGIDCEIQTASNGQEALVMINKFMSGSDSSPDYIFIDLNMPVMDGFEFVRVFQRMEFPHKERVTLIILTSSADERDKLKAIELGVSHFISKPLTEEDVSRIIF